MRMASYSQAPQSPYGVHGYFRHAQETRDVRVAVAAMDNHSRLPLETRVSALYRLLFMVASEVYSAAKENGIRPVGNYVPLLLAALVAADRLQASILDFPAFEFGALAGMSGLGSGLVSIGEEMAGETAAGNEALSSVLKIVGCAAAAYGREARAFEVNPSLIDAFYLRRVSGILSEMFVLSVTHGSSCQRQLRGDA